MKGFEMSPLSKPQVIDSEQVCMYDCDDTLVMWHDKFLEPQANTVEVKSIYCSSTSHLIPNDRHIQLLKQMHARGRFIVVWSAAGNEWAKAVVEALQLEPYVHLIMSKPLTYVDDLPCEEWMGKRIYLTEKKTT